MNNSMIKTVFIFAMIVLSQRQVLAQGPIDQYFGHLAGATPEQGLDFFTRRPVPSELSRIQRFLIQLNQGTQNLDEIQPSLPSGVEISLETDETRDFFYVEDSSTSISPGKRLYEPMPYPGRWVLQIRNQRIWDELIVALSYDVSLMDFLRSNQIHRLVLQAPNLSTIHMVAAIQPPYSFGPREPREGLVIWKTTKSLLPSDMLHGTRFVAHQELGSFFDEFRTWLYSDAFPQVIDRSHVRERYLSLRDVMWAGLRSLGFQQVEKIFPEPQMGVFHFDQILLVLGAIGYRVSPSSENSGFITLIDGEERSLYWRMLLASFLPQGTAAPSLEQEESLQTYFEKVAAAFVLLARHDQIPDVRTTMYSSYGFMITYGVKIGAGRLNFSDDSRATIYATDPTREFPIPRLFFFDDVLKIAEGIDGGRALHRTLEESRRINWNFADAQQRCENLFQNSARPRRRR